MVTLYNEGSPDAVLSAPRLWLLPPGGGDPSPVKGFSGKLAPKGVIAKFRGFTTREAAEALKGLELAGDRLDFPEPEEGEFYHADLLGLKAVTADGRDLGKVESLIDGGAALVLVVVGESGAESLIPFTDEFVPEVDLAGGLLKVAARPGLLD
jgi:16S rRNA processing protein RimM